MIPLNRQDPPTIELHETCHTLHRVPKQLKRTFCSYIRFLFFLINRHFQDNELDKLTLALRDFARNMK